MDKKTITLSLRVTPEQAAWVEFFTLEDESSTSAVLGALIDERADKERARQFRLRRIIGRVKDLPDLQDLLCDFPGQQGAAEND
jgi:hypothetical protein